MRRNETIEAIWNSGDFTGLNRADSRVTVDRRWQIRTANTGGSAMSARRQPARWYQDYAATQQEVDLPTQLIRSIRKSASLDSDCAQLTISCWNADPDGSPNKPAQGMFSQRRGFPTISGLALTASGAARWGPEGLEPNEWSTVRTYDRAHSYGTIAQGNMIRTYQGYGGYLFSGGHILYKTRQQAINDGNIVPTGVWIIDDIDYDDEGNIEITCRDIVSLLVDQIWYPPAIPLGCYPTQFYSREWNLATTGDPRGVIPSRTNYRDLTDIVRLALLWSGFYLKGAPGSADGRWPAIIGGLEDTGIASPSVVSADTFDKKPIIDVIKTIRDIVGYSTWGDQEGGFRFQSPNIWEAGNFDYNGQHHQFVWDLDEFSTLTSLKVKGTKRIDRSSITVAMAEPYANQPGTVKLAAFDTFTDTTKHQLHGLNAPAIIGLDRDIPLREMITLAELTGTRMWFMRRRITASCAANPLIDVDDQIRCWERTTFDTYIHRVQAYETRHDLDSGEYTQDLSGHWLGADNTDWVIVVSDDGHVYYNQLPAGSGGISRGGRGPIHRSLPAGSPSDADAAAIVTPVAP